MDTVRNFFGGQKDAEPPASVLAEWTKYSGEGDVEQGGAKGEDAGLLGSTVPALSGILNQSFKTVSTGISSVSASASTAVQSVPSRQQWYYFSAFLGGGLIMLLLAFSVALPIIVISPSKFAFSFTLGSILIMAAFTALKGWKEQFKHMVTRERIPFSAGYVGSMFGTLYAALAMKSYLFSLLFSGMQVVALLYYVMSYFPGGADGVKFVLKMFYQGVKSCCGMVIGK